MKAKARDNSILRVMLHKFEEIFFISVYPFNFNWEFQIVLEINMSCYR